MSHKTPSLVELLPVDSATVVELDVSAAGPLELELLVEVSDSAETVVTMG